MRTENCSEKTALEVLKISRATLYRWIKNYRMSNLEGLEKVSKRPHNLRRPKWSSQTEKLVLLTRTQYPLWGKEKIAVMIKRNHGKTVSASTVGRIIKKLIENEKLKSVAYYCGKREKKRRQFDGHAKQWKHEMKSQAPGELIQVDHMDVKLISGAYLKHFQAICPITKIAVVQVYTRATSNVASNFLKHLLQHMPFKIISLQVDGGSEFMGDFEQACQNENVDLYVLPPRSPEYNGNVERCNGTMKYEFYYQYSRSKSLNVIQNKLQEYAKIYNNVRPHQGLAYLTPLEYYDQIKSRPLLSHIY